MKEFDVSEGGGFYTDDEIIIIKAAERFITHMGLTLCDYLETHTNKASELAKEYPEKYLIWKTLERLQGRVW